MSDIFNECGSFNAGDLKLNLRQAKELLEDIVKLRDNRIAELERQLAEAQGLIRAIVAEVDNNPDVGCPTSGELWDRVCKYVKGNEE